MFFLYNLLLTVFTILALPFLLVKVLTTKKYRKGLTQRLGILPEGELRNIQGEGPIWVHAVSVGETIAAIPLVRELRRNYPEKKILVTTVTVTGHQTARSQVKEADAILFFPFDMGWIVKKVLKKIGPSMFILIETEIWPNCIRVLSRMQVPILIVNGRISTASYRGYLRVRFLMNRVLQMIDAFSMQTEEDARRIIAMGAPSDRVRNSGSVKFDHHPNPLNEVEKKSMREDYHLPAEGRILVVGSTHQNEEELLIDTYVSLKKEFSDLSMVLAPRHPERAGEVEELLNRKHLAYQRRSSPEPGKPILLLDTVGELSRLYGIGSLSFVGGSLVPTGGHNILEPAIYGVPVVFGPHMENFPEISVVVKERGGGVQVKGSEELVQVMGDLMRDPEKSHRMGNAGIRIIQENQGALKRTLDLIDTIFSGEQE